MNEEDEEKKAIQWIADNLVICSKERMTKMMTGFYPEWNVSFFYEGNSVALPLMGNVTNFDPE